MDEEDSPNQRGNGKKKIFNAKTVRQTRYRHTGVVAGHQSAATDQPEHAYRRNDRKPMQQTLGKIVSSHAINVPSVGRYPVPVGSAEGNPAPYPERCIRMDRDKPLVSPQNFRALSAKARATPMRLNSRDSWVPSAP